MICNQYPWFRIYKLQEFHETTQYRIILFSHKNSIWDPTNTIWYDGDYSTIKDDKIS